MLFVTFLVGALVNFVGYIPIGNINLTVMQLTINRGMKQVYYFLISFSIVEFFFTFAIMKFAQWFATHSNLLRLLDYVLIIVFIVMGTITWQNRMETPENTYQKGNSIRLGLILGVVNPMQIPFWMIAGSYLIAHGWILTGNFALVIFSIGSAFGSFICLLLFAKFARYIRQRFALSSMVLNKTIAFVFFALAAYHIVKVLIVTLRA